MVRGLTRAHSRAAGAAGSIRQDAGARTSLSLFGSSPGLRLISHFLPRQDPGGSWSAVSRDLSVVARRLSGGSGRAARRVADRAVAATGDGAATRDVTAAARFPALTVRDRLQSRSGMFATLSLRTLQPLTVSASVHACNTCAKSCSWSRQQTSYCSDPFTVFPVSIEMTGQWHSASPSSVSSVFTAGSVFSLQFEYESETADLFTADPTFGYYLGAVTSFAFNYAPYSGTTTSGSIAIVNQPGATYFQLINTGGLSIFPAIGGLNFNGFTVSLNFSDPGALTGDLLPSSLALDTTLPPLLAGEISIGFIGAEDVSESGATVGIITSVTSQDPRTVPDAGNTLWLTVGCLSLAGLLTRTTAPRATREPPRALV